MADSHIACRAHAVPLPCHAVKGLELSFPFYLHSAAVSDSHLPCHAHAASMSCSDHAVALRRTAWSEHCMEAAWAWHGKCETDKAALCKSNGKDTF
jgi:hypothetical protein